MLCDRLVGEWLASGREAPPSETEALTVTELIARYWRFAKKHCRTGSAAGDGSSQAAWLIHEFIRWFGGEALATNPIL